MLSLVLAVVVSAVVTEIPARHIPEQFKIVGPVEGFVNVKLHARENVAALETRLAQVSNPKLATYGQYLSPSELSELSVISENVNAITSWLDAQRVRYTVTHNVVEFTVAAPIAEALLNTKFNHYERDGQKALLAGAYTLPTSVAAATAAVFGLHDFPLPRRAPLVGAPNVYGVTPATLMDTYKVGGVTVSGSTNNRQAVVEFQGQYANQDDLDTFFKNYLPKAPANSSKIYKYVGSNTQGDGVEALLDIQYIMALNPGVLSEMWAYPGMQFCTDLTTWLTTLIGQADFPNVFSVSYGWQGDMSQLGCTDGQISSVNAQLMKAALKGVSIMISSGDSGSQEEGSKLYDSWPAQSPYITAVGATRFINQQPSGGEQACDQFGSGGGISFRNNTRPTWQVDAVSHYFNTVAKSKIPPATMYGKGRATPDVAALGEGYQVIMRGKPISVGGTSASSPAFASMVSLINEARIAAGKPTMGFLNPFLYQNEEDFNDIVVGDNLISRYGSRFQYGYYCVTGYEPVCGLGTPQFDALLKDALAA